MTAPSATGIARVFSEHEEVVFFRDPTSGLRAIVAIYSTALGPAIGGTRFYPYRSEDEALTDVLALSKAMAYKTSFAGMDHGGGKAVIIGDPLRDRSEPLLRAYGRFLQSLNGRYITACDIGTTSEDMDIVARECRFTTGRSVEFGGAGDSSVLTAEGVYQGLLAVAQFLWGEESLARRTVGISGVGKVGSNLVRLVVEAGAKVIVSDIDAQAVERVRSRHPQVEVVTGDRLVDGPLDIFAPCAVGRVVDESTVERLRAKVVCGAANNQLAHRGIGDLLRERGIVYVPDYAVNSGGVIQVADELHGFSFDRARHEVLKIKDKVLTLLQEARRRDVDPQVIAAEVAESRMHGLPRLRNIWVA